MRIPGGRLRLQTPGRLAQASAFHRRFVGLVFASTGRGLRNARRLQQNQPLAALGVSKIDRPMHEFAASPGLARLVGLDLSEHRLRRLDVQSSAITATGAETLLDSPLAGAAGSSFPATPSAGR